MRRIGASPPRSSDTDDATEAGPQFCSVGRIGPSPLPLQGNHPYIGSFFVPRFECLPATEFHAILAAVKVHPVVPKKADEGLSISSGEVHGEARGRGDRRDHRNPRGQGLLNNLE